MAATVLSGVDRLSEYAHLLEGKRLGLITGPTGLDLRFRSTIDILHERFHLAALFSPEHGVRGDHAAGGVVDSYEDPATGVPVYSIYRRDSKRLTAEMLDQFDLLVYDIQDIGVRYYTYIYTMLYALEDCAQAGKPFVVLDRPNPLDGLTVEGNVLKDGYRSFVGNYPLCIRYGLTAGELALMANEQTGWHCRLHVIPCAGWERMMQYPDTERLWVPTSMNIPRFETALLYPGTCLFEGANVSEGRGTAAPFEMIGAPYIDAERLAREMNGKGLPGVIFRPVYFRPTASKYNGELCRGVQLHVSDRRALRPVETGFVLMDTMRRMHDDFSFLPPIKENSRPFIDLLCGERLWADSELDMPALLERMREESRQFAAEVRQYHIY